MTRYIKLDEWEKCFDKMMTGCPLPKKTIAKIKQMWVDEMPTADVVEVTDKSMESLVKGLEILGDTSLSAENPKVDERIIQRGDLISRADAIEAVHKYFMDLLNDEPYETDEDGDEVFTDMKSVNTLLNHNKAVSKAIKALPSADRPSGEWIIRDNGNKECSLCGHERQDGWDYFCGYCGAKMGSDGLCGEWKLVSEELPQSVGSYIVTCKDEHGKVYVDYDYWTVADRFKYNCSKVTAWIPFPKPYCGADMRGKPHDD